MSVMSVISIFFFKCRWLRTLLPVVNGDISRLLISHQRELIFFKQSASHFWNETLNLFDCQPFCQNCVNQRYLHKMSASAKNHILPRSRAGDNTFLKKLYIWVFPRILRRNIKFVIKRPEKTNYSDFESVLWAEVISYLLTHKTFCNLF